MPIVSLGIVLYSYLRLKLHLRIAGFAPVFHDYDWRLGIDELGKGLAARLDAETASRVMIVAHSMGGLVTRAAMATASGSKVERVVLLGAPNLGSFAPVQALRGTYAVVRKIARLALEQSAEMLAAEVFKTFPSLYHLLPVPEVSPRLDFFDPRSWPATGPQPDVALLTRARKLGALLAPGDKRFAVIVGAGQETVTSATRRGEQFQYTITRHGDGTVPTACALLPGASTHYTSVAHSELARDEVIARAIADLLKSGRTKRLQTKPARISTAEARITDAELRRTHTAESRLGRSRARCASHLPPDAERAAAAAPAIAGAQEKESRASQAPPGEMTPVTIVWFRQDLRLRDNPALDAAVKRGAVVPVYIWSPEEEGDWPPGAASRWWLHQSLQALDASLRERGSQLILAEGPRFRRSERWRTHGRNGGVLESPLRAGGDRVLEAHQVGARHRDEELQQRAARRAPRNPESERQAVSGLHAVPPPRAARRSADASLARARKDHRTEDAGRARRHSPPLGLMPKIAWYTTMAEDLAARRSRCTGAAEPLPETRAREVPHGARAAGRARHFGPVAASAFRRDRPAADLARARREGAHLDVPA